VIKDWHTILAPNKPTVGHHKQIKWCEERFGKRWSVIDNREGIWCCFWGGNKLPGMYRFEFKNEKDAILFSLTWL
jgi:hypothetical protein